jgi:hypothetical protein
LPNKNNRNGVKVNKIILVISKLPFNLSKEKKIYLIKKLSPHLINSTTTCSVELSLQDTLALLLFFVWQMGNIGRWEGKRLKERCWKKKNQLENRQVSLATVWCRVKR